MGMEKQDLRKLSISAQEAGISQSGNGSSGVDS